MNTLEFAVVRRYHANGDEVLVAETATPEQAIKLRDAEQAASDISSLYIIAPLYPWPRCNKCLNAQVRIAGRFYVCVSDRCPNMAPPAVRREMREPTT